MQQYACALCILYITGFEIPHVQTVNILHHLLVYVMSKLATRCQVSDFCHHVLLACADLLAQYGRLRLETNLDLPGPGLPSKRAVSVLVFNLPDLEFNKPTPVIQPFMGFMELAYFIMKGVELLSRWV